MGVGTSFWVSYLLPQVWMVSWDDPVGMWLVDGVLLAAVGAWLAFRARRANAD